VKAQFLEQRPVVVVPRQDGPLGRVRQLRGAVDVESLAGGVDALMQVGQLVGQLGGVDQLHGGLMDARARSAGRRW
jgi:hypothetical protein